MNNEWGGSQYSLFIINYLLLYFQLLLWDYAAEVKFLVGVVDDGVAVAFGTVVDQAFADGQFLSVEDNLAAAFEHHDKLAVGFVAVETDAGVGRHADAHDLV